MRLCTALLAAVVALPLAGCAPNTPPLQLGAVFPLSGSTGALGMREFQGVQLAVDLSNRAGGIHGRQVQLQVRDVSSAEQADAAVRGLVRRGAPLVLGAYSSDLSLATSAATARMGAVYWEAGAVADKVTGRGLPRVFRVGATGGNLGQNAGRFVVEQLAPRLHRAPSSLRAVLVVADDAYARSVAAAATARLHSSGIATSESWYDPYRPDWVTVLDHVRTARADVLLLASHIPDGIAFRRAFLAARLHVDAFVGTTMAQCLPDFGRALGADAVGVFASDRPGEGFDGTRLTGPGRLAWDRFTTAWRKRYGGSPDEEALSGYAAASVLLEHVLARARSLDPEGIARAARDVDLPEGSLANGAGVRFSDNAGSLGQNTRAGAVVWQWQAPRHSVVVWPAALATGVVRLVPLPR